MDFVNRLAGEFKLRPQQVQAAVELLEPSAEVLLRSRTCGDASRRRDPLQQDHPEQGRFPLHGAGTGTPKDLWNAKRTYL